MREPLRTRRKPSGFRARRHASRNRNERSAVYVPNSGSRPLSGDTSQEVLNMGIGVSLILVAAGAILAFAVNATVSGLDINTVGYILIVVGAVGLVLSMMFWSSWGGVGGT